MNGININLTITSPDLHDAFLALAEAVNQMSSTTAPISPPKTEEPKKIEKVSKPKPEEKDSVKEETVSFTLEQVRKLSMDKSKKDKAAVKAAIAKVGASKVTEIDEEKYPEYMKLLEAI